MLKTVIEWLIIWNPSRRIRVSECFFKSWQEIPFARRWDRARRRTKALGTRYFGPIRFHPADGWWISPTTSHKTRVADRYAALPGSGERAALPLSPPFDPAVFARNSSLSATGSPGDRWGWFWHPFPTWILIVFIFWVFSGRIKAYVRFMWRCCLNVCLHLAH